MASVVGIDVSKAKLDVVVMDAKGNTEATQVDNTPAGDERLRAWLQRRVAAGSAVCMEATGRYADGVATDLYEAGYRVSVVNPARIRGYANSQLRRNKTDLLDAKLIADFCRTQQPDAWQPMSESLKALQAMVRHLATLEDTKQQLENRLRDAKSLPVIVVGQLHAQHAFLLDQIKQLKKAIQDHLDQDPDLKNKRDLLDSIPSIAPLTAAKLLAECRAFADFNDVRQLVAFAGLNPAHHQSGSSIRKKTLISKTGNAAIRAALFMPAVVAQKHNPILSAFAQRLRQRALAGLAVTTAVMRKLLHLVFAILKSGRPFDPNFQFAA